MGLDRKKLEALGTIADVKPQKPGKIAPLMFNFRPAKYIVVAPDHLKEWEELFAKQIGFPPDRKKLFNGLQECGWSGDPKETISGSNCPDIWDDCDYG